MKNIGSYLIHNNSKDRISLRNNLKKFTESSNLKLIEIYRQKNIKSKYSKFKYKISILKVNLLRTFYDSIHKKEFTLDYLIFILKSILKYIKLSIITIFQNSEEDKRIYKHIKIEKYVMLKHLQAWNHFLNSENNLVIVFEDDVICKKFSKQRLDNLVSKLNSTESQFIYVDLAGGYSTNKVVPKNLIKMFNSEKISVKAIFTNTACSYLMNRSLVKKLYKEFHKSKYNIVLPIDHLVNKLGFSLQNSNKVFSIHFREPIFTHGSFNGNIKSWQNK